MITDERHGRSVEMHRPPLIFVTRWLPPLRRNQRQRWNQHAHG